MSVASDLLPNGVRAETTQRPDLRQLLVAAGRHVAKFLQIVGFGWIVTFGAVLFGDDRKQSAKALWKQLGIPLLAIALFLVGWAWLAPKVHTSLGGLPGPQQVLQQASNLWADH